MVKWVLRVTSAETAAAAVSIEVRQGMRFSAAALQDRGVDNERPYVYALRALRLARGTVARSETSGRVTAMAVDTTPPAPPTELVAVPSTGAGS